MPTGDLDQPSSAIALAVAICLRRVAQACRQGAGIVFAQVLIRAQFANVVQLARLMADLSQKGGNAQGRVDVVSRHGAVEVGNENARLGAGVRVDLE
ncbi:hypothetical protein D3C86_1751070 [compost metagenome]